MAVMRRCLRTKEARTVEHLWCKTILDLAFRHKPKEALLLRAPVTFFFLISLEHLVGWSEQWLVHILDVSILRRKKARSLALAKPASCEVLCSRTSITLLTPASKSRLKNSSALVLVNPILETFALATIVTPRLCAQLGQAVIRQKRPFEPAPDMLLPTFPRVGQTSPPRSAR
jgi:hypothetical protein